MRGHPIPVYHSIFGILNLAGKLATGAPSKSSQVTALSEVLNYLNLCSSLSIRACVSFEVRVGIVTRWGGNLNLTMQSERYGLWWWLIGWRGWWRCRVVLGAILRQDLLGLLPIYPPVEASYSLLNQSHGRNKLVNGNYLWVHISLIWSLVWLVWCFDQFAPTLIHEVKPRPNVSMLLQHRKY